MARTAGQAYPELIGRVKECRLAELAEDGGVGATGFFQDVGQNRQTLEGVLVGDGLGEGDHGRRLEC